MDNGLTVIGDATLDVEPDYARLRLEILEQKTSMQAALAGAERRADDLRAVVDRFGDSISREQVTHLWSRPRSDYRRGERVDVGYEAGYGMELDLVDMHKAGSLIDMATGVAAVEVYGPSYLVDDDNDVWDRVRRLAAEDARRRGVAFAGGLGVTLGPVLAVADPRVLNSGGGSGYLVCEDRAAEVSRGFSLEGMVSVSAEVCVSFALEPQPAATRSLG